MPLVFSRNLSLGIHSVVSLAMITYIAGCAGTPVKPLESSADTLQLNHAQRVVWQESDEQDAAFRNMGLIYEDPVLEAYLQAVMYRLYPKFRGAINIHALKSPAPNAFMMANGSCYVQIGLLALLDDEAELATVLGHEGGHFIRQHGVQEHEYDENTAALGMTLGITLIGPLIATSSIYGYSREMESQADAIGFQRLLAAGYDVDQAPIPFERLDAYSQALDLKQPYFFADHPKLEERIQYFTAQAALVKQTNGYTGTKDYLTATSKARMWVLQDDLSRQDYKSIMFFLDNRQQFAEYPPEACYYLGRAYQLRNSPGDAQRAETELLDCTKQVPNFAQPYAALGKLLMEEGKNAQALTALETYLQLAPNAADTSYIRLYIKRLSPNNTYRNNL